MADTTEHLMLSTEKSSTKPSIELHNIDLPKNDPQGFNERISSIAYQLFLNRGAGHGNDLGDWLEAEQMVLAQMKSEKNK